MRIILGIFFSLFIFLNCSYAYTDVSSSHWAYSDLEILSEQGIVSGYPDGSFKPNQEISKAEFLSLLTKSMFPNADVSDVSGKWYEGFYRYLVSEELLNLYTFSEEKLQEPIRRFEAGEAFVYCFPLAKEAYLEQEGNLRSSFWDTKGEQEGVLAEILSETSIFQGYPDGSIGFDKTVSRAEMICMFSNLLKQKEELENFRWSTEEIIYEDNIAISTDLQMYSELQPYQYSKDEKVITTKINHLELIESLEELPERYQSLADKLETDHPYYRQKKSYIDGNKLIIVEFDTINHSKKYSLWTGYSFLQLDFAGQDIQIIDCFDTDEFYYVDEELPAESVEVMPQETHHTVAVYVVSELPQKICFHRDVTTMYEGDTYIPFSSFQALMLYL